jgi:hypothetical protein
MIMKLETMNIFHSPSPKSQDKSSKHTAYVPEPSVPYEPSAITVRDKVKTFYLDFGDELNCELDKFLPPFDSSTDFCDNVKNIAEFTECRDIYTFYPTTTEAIGYRCLASLVPTDTYKSPIPLVTSWASGTTEDEAQQNAAQKLLFLFKATRRAA